MGFAGALHQLTLHRIRAKERLIIPANFHCKDCRSLPSEVLIPTPTVTVLVLAVLVAKNAESGENLLRDGSGNLERGFGRSVRRRE